MKIFLTIILFLLMAFLLPIKAQAEEIKLLSYNVYFDDETGNTRYPEIIKFIKQGNYNLIALQECTPKFLSLLNYDAKLRYFTRAQGSLSDGYTNVILTSLKTVHTGNIKLPTNMGRSAPYVKLEKLNMMIVNVHLESGLFNSRMRKQQLNTILDEVNGLTRLMIVGDTNFADGDDEEQLLHQFQDLGFEGQQVTYDVELNTLAQKTKFPLEVSSRLDRLFIKCPSCEIKQFNLQQERYSDHWPISSIVEIQ
jgi:endonuclease/exonuclease/phosphatase family metal-dependent hydrolase